MTPTIDVRLGAGAGIAEAIAEAASRLGAAPVVRASQSPRTWIGDVELPRSPEPWRIEAALLRALAPRHVLFLCVANSARSQLAEGIARGIAGDRVKVSSAGSTPTAVRPQAVAVLAEIGIDISGHRSKGVEDVERPVDAVITLCAEEVCPLWLDQARRLHWGVPDPTGVEGTEERRLEAFRAVRDELRERLGVLLAAPRL